MIKNSKPSGFYQIYVDTPRRLLLARSRQGRIWQSVLLAIGSVICLLMAQYSWLRPQRDLTGAAAFGVFGLGLALLAGFSASYSKEIDFDSDRGVVTRRITILGIAVAISEMPFTRIKMPQVETLVGEWDSFRIKLTVDGKIWESLDGFTIRNHARILREKIKVVMSESLTPKS